MLKRYTLSEMGAVWEELNKKQKWLDVEFAVIKAKELIKEIPGGTHDLTAGLKVTAGILKRADEIEEITDHDLIAFVLAITEQLDDRLKPYFHAGLTSYDIEDTGLAIQMLDALDLIEAKLSKLVVTLEAQAQDHRYSYMIGRSHGIHGEPTTFGLKLLDWIRAFKKHLEKIAALKKEVGIGTISGAMGTYLLSPMIEELACRELGLEPALVSTQVIGRDVHVSYILTLVQLANTLDRCAIEIRNLSRTDIGEVAEFKRKGNKGSSAMPAKSLLRNPIKSENISGLAKVMRGYVHPILECELLWHERTLDNSAAERVIIPDVSILVHFMLNRFEATMDKLVVYTKRMESNVLFTKGLVFAQPVMIALTEKGMDRDKAYDLVEGLALEIDPQTFTTEEGYTFQDLVKNNGKVGELLTPEELDPIFNHKNKVKYINETFARFNL